MHVPGANDPEDELAALLRAVHQGCQPSFARLYVLTSPRVFAAVLRISRDRADAEDVLQEVFVKVWSRCDQYDPNRGPVMFWLFGIARHGALDCLRRSQRRPQRGGSATATDDDPYAELPSDALQPMELVSRSRSAQAVQRCLASISNERRECLTLSFYDELTHEQIARRVGRPIGTVKTWLRRSLISMRSVLSGHE